MKSMLKFYVIIILLVNVTSHALEPTKGTLITITAYDFLQLPENFQALYVAGAIDGMTLVSYGYALPDHDALIACYRRQSLGDLTKEVVEVAKSYPDFQESVATLIAKTAGKLCPH